LTLTIDLEQDEIDFHTADVIVREFFRSTTFPLGA
jgi:hypothetical protein